MSWLRPRKAADLRKKFTLILFCAQSSRRHCCSVKKYFCSKSGPYGDSSRGASDCAQEVAKTGEMPHPPGTTKMSLVGSDFRGWWARTRLLRRQTVREWWGESSHMRAGGATEAIWDGSARHFRETECKYRRCRNPLMYRPAPTRGGGTPSPTLKLGAWSYFWCCNCPQGVHLA